MGSKRHRQTKIDEPFVAIKRSVFGSLSALSPHACQVLMILAGQYKGDNNGDLTLAFSVISQNGGVCSKSTLIRCKRELIDAGLIYVTRKGHFPSTTELVALTWFPLDVNPKFDPEALSGFTPKAYLNRQQAPPIKQFDST